jgi:hypothetical protein
VRPRRSSDRCLQGDPQEDLYPQLLKVRRMGRATSTSTIEGMNGNIVDRLGGRRRLTGMVSVLNGNVRRRMRSSRLNGLGWPSLSRSRLGGGSVRGCPCHWENELFMGTSEREGGAPEVLGDLIDCQRLVSRTEEWSRMTCPDSLEEPRTALLLPCRDSCLQSRDHILELDPFTSPPGCRPLPRNHGKSTAR